MKPKIACSHTNLSSRDWAKLARNCSGWTIGDISKMANDTDFVVLYDELGLGPDCTLEALKRAYRRRVGHLHPDHAGPLGDIPRLQRLNRLYESAIAFHRLHGRLPGALPAQGHGGDPEAASGRGTDPAPPPAAQAPARPPSLTGSAPHPRYAIALVLAAAALLWLKLGENPRDRPEPGSEPPQPARGSPAAGPAAGGEIKLGMEAGRVVAIQGPPLNAYERRWDYGPSWIGFHCGKVIDWYSSPLRPLRVGSDSPARAAGEAPGPDADPVCRTQSIHGEK